DPRPSLRLRHARRGAGGGRPAGAARRRPPLRAHHRGRSGRRPGAYGRTVAHRPGVTATATMELETAVAARLDREAMARRMDDVRRRTLELIAVLDSATLRRQHIPILSPMVWDVGHIGNFEEQWIGQRLAGLP